MPAPTNRILEQELWFGSLDSLAPMQVHDTWIKIVHKSKPKSCDDTIQTALKSNKESKSFELDY